MLLLLVVGFLCVFIWFVFWYTLVCSFVYLGTFYGDEAGLKLTEIFVSASWIM